MSPWDNQGIGVKSAHLPGLRLPLSYLQALMRISQETAPPFSDWCFVSASITSSDIRTRKLKRRAIQRGLSKSPEFIGFLVC